MARFHQASQRQTDKRWDYTVSSDDEGWMHAQGYCAGWREWTEAEIAKMPGMNWEMHKKDMDRRRPFQELYHKDGHATAEEAEACFQSYQLDLYTRYNETEKDVAKRCKVCNEFTENRVEFGREMSQLFVLCGNHSTRDYLVPLLT